MTDHGTLDLLDALAALPEPGSPGPDVHAILALLNGDPLHASDRERVVEAITAEAQAHDGHVDPNRVRERLTRVNADGTTDLTVYPRVIGAVYSGLTRAGVLTFTGWVDSTDTRGGNRGKPARAYRLNRPPETA